MADVPKVKPFKVYSKDGTGPLALERLVNYTCPLCDHILCDPMQGECGDRFCKGCLDEKLLDVHEFCCPRCSEAVKRNEIFPDRGCKREINSLQTMCDCGKLISLAAYSKHVTQECNAIKKPCPFGCGKSFSVADMPEHLNCCPMRTVNCKHCHQHVREKELQEHYEVCSEYPNECPYCYVKFDDKAKVSHHLRYECDEKRHSCILCGQEGNKRKIAEHFDANHSFLMLKQMEFLNAVVSQMNARIELLEREKLNSSRSHEENVEQLKKKIAHQNSKIEELKDSAEKVNERSSSRISMLERELKTIKQELLNGAKLSRFDEVEKDSPGNNKSLTDSSYKTQPESISRSMPTADTYRPQPNSYDITRFASKSMPPSLQPVAMGENVVSMKSELVKTINQLKDDMLNRATQQETSLEYSKSEIEKIFKLLQAQDDNIMKQKQMLEDVHLRQELQEVKATKGVFIWKINDLGRRKQDANDGRVLSLYSPPFFTSFHGYRMCIRCYLNGDGSGKGTHVSVFFVMMKSEHDDLLPWPFKQKVTISLLNQETPSESSSHITQSFMPDAKSSSFQKPTKDMNIASGFPKFASRSVLNEKRYSNNDTVYFKVKVDLSDIPLD